MYVVGVEVQVADAQVPGRLRAADPLGGDEQPLVDPVEGEALLDTHRGVVLTEAEALGAPYPSPSTASPAPVPVPVRSSARRPGDVRESSSMALPCGDRRSISMTSSAPFGAAPTLHLTMTAVMEEPGL
ncbi:hypothetical protein GCM10014715_38410 [Streptomyces spiralis]|uniref:Uncharacterized protein n=1 Tax=Streptomyces spiralis TaxID=66376 RepID=A0A919DU82_9ACTN|nr:hypothetical protein GCM10014715_38410 [Streptomyces spiralis]